MARVLFEAGERESDGNLQPQPTNSSLVSKPTKRQRWATQRRTGQSAVRKRLSILNRVPKVHVSAYEEKPEAGEAGRVAEDSPTGQEAEDPSEESRTVYMNMPLPDEAKDENGNPKARFGRNKIRTAKYTPLSFIPKNLFLQFHNIANIYFLFIVILGIFSIFGVVNPGLSAVPLIVILFLTAVKDAIEDWRRTVLDNELNNSPVHRLVGWKNVNSSEDNISPWRRTKKASTRVVVNLYRSLKHRSAQGSKASEKEAGEGVARNSTDTRPTIRTSIDSRRESVYSVPDAGEDIAMTPVPSPVPRAAYQANGHLAPHPATPRSSSSFETARADLDGEYGADDHDAPSAFRTKAGTPRRSAVPAAKDYGDLVNPHRESPGTARFAADHWKNVQVGDFVRIFNNEQIPADMVILSTADHDGACYVETKNLDGETNLKVRHALQAGRRVRHARDCERAEFVISSEGPQPNLYSYSAVVRWRQRDPHDPDRPARDMAEPVTINNVLLRGCNVRNTEWVLGVVVFTGRESKIMLNSGVTPSKRARLARELNKNVIYNFVILFCMCLVCGIVQGVTWRRGGHTAAYFEFGNTAGAPPVNGFVTFWAAVILFQNLVPIALYISLEIVRSAQAFFIYSDTHMYYERLEYPCTPKSWNISDDLGQIEYVFSDKTGTLTQNVMEFKKCTINGRAYGEAFTEAEAGMRQRQGEDVARLAVEMGKHISAARVEMLRELRQLHDNPYFREQNLTFVAPDLVRDLRGRHGAAQSRACEHFMVALALCHTVITETTPGDPPTIEYKAQSPDEAALVATARDCGFTVLGRTSDDLLVNVHGEDRTYRVLNTLEFNSTRKRMSAIVRMPDGRIKLFCKGADSMIYSRLAPGAQQDLRKTTAEDLETFAREGLRTLCVAERDVDEEDYAAWSRAHDAAAQALTHREDRLEEAADAIERDLLLLGGTAIEDRLQDGVPDTIALLGRAGIKLWVLTGDKVETAINIGFSCNLLSNEMELLLFDLPGGGLEAAGRLLDDHLRDKFGLTGSEAELIAARANHEPPAPTHALIIDGESLKLVLDDALRLRFLLLCKQCKSVLCCRVSPAQKAAVVSLVKHGLDVMALSIGDGANDVAMIQEADVGVGIAGEEGRQAVMSSDYAIGQFRYLQRLVLVHGRWSYRRLAESIANFFYKNMVWTFALFWYQIYTDFDIVYLFEYTYVLLVNLAFTSLPVILMGVLDQDVSDKVSLAVPQLYRKGMERREWTQTKFWLYMADGMYQSAICYFMGHLVFAPATFATADGRDVNDQSRMGVYIACPAIIVINGYVLLNTYRWDWLMVLICAVSTLLIFFWTGVYSSFTGSFKFYRAAGETYGTLTFWALALLTVVICLLPRFCVKFFQKNFRPYDVDVIRERVRQGHFDYLDRYDAYVPPKAVAGSGTSSETAEDGGAGGAGPPPPAAARHRREASTTESQRPIYPPSEAPTRGTRHPHSQTGSDGTDRTVPSLERLRASPEPPRPVPRPPMHERARSRPSFDRMRPSFEASRDFTSAAHLQRVESSYSQPGLTPVSTRRMRDLTDELR